MSATPPPIDMGAARIKLAHSRTEHHDDDRAGAPGQQQQWPVEPVDIIGAGGAVGWPELTRDCIPEPLYRYVMVEAERLNVDPCPIAAHVLAACSAVCSDKWRVRSKKHDTAFTQHPRLWVCVVKDVGSRGTAMINSAFWPIRRIEDKYRADWQRELAVWLERKAERKKGEQGQDPKPVMKRITTNDTTIEATSQILEGGGDYGKMAVVCDELSGWLSGFNRYDKSGGGAARGYWLESYDGGPRMIDRVLRGHSFVPNWSVCIAGNIQPRRLGNLGKHLIDDGLFQRFMTIHTKPSDVGIDDDQPIDMAAGRDYSDLIRVLRELEPSVDLSGKYPPAYFEDEAVEVRHKFMKLVDRLRVDPSFPTIIRETAPKWSGLLARLALVFHLVELAEQYRFGEVVSQEQFHRVTVRTVTMAARFIRRLVLPNLMRLGYETLPEEGAPESNARWIAGHVLAHGLDRVIGRDIGRACHQLRGKPEEIEQAMEVLVHAGWADRINTARRDSLQWHVNPAVHSLYAPTAAAEKERRKRVVEAIRQKVEDC